jgi:hypothetical protein
VESSTDTVRQLGQPLMGIRPAKIINREFKKRIVIVIDTQALNFIALF